MGNRNKRRGENQGWEDTLDGDSHDESSSHNSNSFYGKHRNGNGINPKHGKNKGGNIGEQRASDQQDHPNFDSYLEAIVELKTQISASQKAMEHVMVLSGKQQREIQNAVETQQRLLAAEIKVQEFKTTLRTVQNEKSDQEEELAQEYAVIAKEKEELERAKEDAEKSKRELKEEREKFTKRVSATEVEQEKKLLEQREKLEKEQSEQYEKRVKAFEDKTMKRQVELENKNNELSQKLDEQRVKLKETEGRLKDAEKLKESYESDAEKLKKELRLAENEFGLATETTEFYKEEFLKIYQEILDISARYMKELPNADPNSLHETVKKVDGGFELVPISDSEVSAQLRVVHAQRVIAAQLQNIIWQPFSSETTQPILKDISLFNQISRGLRDCYGEGGGLRATRLYTTLTMRGLQSQPPTKRPSSTLKTSAPLLVRAQKFSNNVTSVLSPLVKHSLQPSFQNSLLDLAMSAINLWDIAQTDEREITVDTDIDPASIEGWHKAIPQPQKEVLVLFPRIIARSYSRKFDSHTIGPPGRWVDSEPESLVQEICIYSGKGLGKWSQLVIDGEEEEEERKENEEIRILEEKKKATDEVLKKKRENPATGRRRMSQNKTGSFSGPASKPSAMWTTGSVQKVNEGDD